MPIEELSASTGGGTVLAENIVTADGWRERDMSSPLASAGADGNPALDDFYTFDPSGNVCQTLRWWPSQQDDGYWTNTMRQTAEAPPYLLSTRAYDAWGTLLNDIDSTQQQEEPQTSENLYTTPTGGIGVGEGPAGFGAQSGYQSDPQTGLVLAGHRYYQPATRRWLNRDPIGYEGGINLYAYCGNDPVNEADPDGTDSVGGVADGMIDPNEVRFSQNGYSEEMRGPGGTKTGVTNLAAGLRNGSIAPESLKPIRLVRMNNAIYTLDNRRLLAAHQAKKDIPYRWATKSEIAAAIKKGRFSTENGGTFIERNSDIRAGIDVMSRFSGVARGAGNACEMFNLFDLYCNDGGYLDYSFSDHSPKAQKQFLEWLKVWHPDEVDSYRQMFKDDWLRSHA